MLDENLPTFHLSQARDQPEHLSTFYQSRGGREPEAAYNIHHPDPNASNAKNCYAVALFDPHNPEVLFGEVFLRPKWSQVSATQQEDIRRAGGVPPPPEPVLPDEFVIQLYNPDQQIQVKHHTGGLVGNPYWEFSIPQETFRSPSGSQLDRSQNDPGINPNTPKLYFKYKRESKITKEMTCYLTGKSTDIVKKRGNKDPDITIALFKSLKEVTIYEPNLSRVEIEDPKGLEVALLLASLTIREVYFGTLRGAFNISETERRRGSSGTSRLQPSNRTRTNSGHGNQHSPPVTNRPVVTSPVEHDHPPLPHRPGPPLTDARTQWAIDAETQRLRAVHDAEVADYERRKQAERRERERAAEEETRRLRKMVEAEAKAARDRQKQIEKETERLRKIYGNQQPLPPRPGQAPSVAVPPAGLAARVPAHVNPPPRPHSAQPGAMAGYPQYPRPGNTGGGGQPYLAAPGQGAAASSSAIMSGALPARQNKRRSFFNLRESFENATGGSSEWPPRQRPRSGSTS